MNQPYVVSPSGTVPAAHGNNEERPLRDIIGDVWTNTEKLVRQEMELGMAELERKTAALKKDLAMAAVGGGVLLMGAMALVASLILLLSKAVDPWLSALIVGVAMSGIGFMLVQRGKKAAVNEGVMPEQTIHSVQRSAHTLKEAIK